MLAGQRTFPDEIKDYIRGTKKTAKRIKSHLDDEKTKGSTVHLDTIKFEEFSILTDSSVQRYELISMGSLCNPFVRKMMEDFGVLTHDPTSCEILNKAGSLMERRRDKAMLAQQALDAMTPEERRTYFAKYDSSGS